MSRSRLKITVLAVGLVVSLAATAFAPGIASAKRRHPRLPRVPQGFVGMVLDGPVFPDADNHINLAHQLDVMVASGVQTLHVEFDWGYAQPYSSWGDVPPDQQGRFEDAAGMPTRFDAMDQLVTLAAHRRLTILPDILNAPDWDAEHHSGAAVNLPVSDYWYSQFAQALVSRYGPSGDFWGNHPSIPRVPITMWQVWNEQNITPYWPDQPFAARYVALLSETGRAIKSVDPNAKIVLGGMPDYSWINLAQIYRAGGRGLFDVVAIHPYTRRPQGVITILRYVRRVMNAAGDGRKPIVADEVSWPSSLGKTYHTQGFDFATTESGEARNLGVLMPLLARNRLRLRLMGFDYYTWAGLERIGHSAFEFGGLFRIRGGQFIAKPAYPVFRREALAMEHCRRKAAVATRCLKPG